MTGKLGTGEKIVVKTDMVVAEIDTAGGDLSRLELLQYPDTADKNKSFALLQSQDEHVYVAQSGLIGEGLPSHKTNYTADQSTYELAAGAEKIEIRLLAPEAEGVRVVKDIHIPSRNLSHRCQFRGYQSGNCRDPALLLFPDVARQPASSGFGIHDSHLYRRRALHRAG